MNNYPHRITKFLVKKIPPILATCCEKTKAFKSMDLMSILAGQL